MTPTHTVIIRTEDDLHRFDAPDADAVISALAVFASEDVRQVDIFPAGGRTPNIKRLSKTEAKEQDDHHSPTGEPLSQTSLETPEP